MLALRDGRALLQQHLAATSLRLPALDSLQWREAEGRRKMVRTQAWKYVHDPMGDGDALYDLVNDPHEFLNVVDEEKIARSWPICGCAWPIGVSAPRTRRRCPCPSRDITNCPETLLNVLEQCFHLHCQHRYLHPKVDFHLHLH